jgi:hypothetical protein
MRSRRRAEGGESASCGSAAVLRRWTSEAFNAECRRSGRRSGTGRTGGAGALSPTSFDACAVPPVFLFSDPFLHSSASYDVSPTFEALHRSNLST